MLIKIVDHSKQGGIANTLEDKNNIQNNFNRLKKSLISDMKAWNGGEFDRQ